jgi:GTP-sensing pleiotropic transcriptional regulator CodY
MPKISDLIVEKEKKKKFVRKEYRPWNLSDTLSKETREYESLPESNVIEKVATIVEHDLKIVQSDSPSLAIKIDRQTNPKEHISSFIRPEKIDLTVDDLLIQLSGRQKELLILIIRNLIDHHSLVTSPIYAQFLVEKISTSLGTIKNAVRRLEAKGVIKSISKRARGGYYRFEVREEVIQAGQRLFFRP